MLVNRNDEKAREDEKLDEKANNDNLFARLPNIVSGHDATTM
jgi:hypothetical protein